MASLPMAIHSLRKNPWLVVTLYVRSLSAPAIALSLLAAPLGCSSESDKSTATDDADDDTNRNEDSDSDDNDDTGDEDEDDKDESEGSGNFAAIWRQASAEVMVLDTTNPTAPTSVDVKMPSSLPIPGSEHEVEVFEQIKDGKHVTYAWVQDAPEYYRITTQTVGSDEAYLIQQGDSIRTFSMTDGGNLYSLTTLGVGSTLIQSTTTYKEYKAEFPPDGWPNKAVDSEIGDVQ
jgi:hypothetical protein